MSEAEPILPLSDPATTEAQASRISIPAHVDSWDEYFLNIAKAVSIKSKDPKCPVGAVIVSDDNIVLSTGFNGLPRGVHDDEHVLLDANEKLRVICHAEDNAIMNAARVGGRPLQGTTIYVTKFPCLACCNAAGGPPLASNSGFRMQQNKWGLAHLSPVLRKVGYRNSRLRF